MHANAQRLPDWTAWFAANRHTLSAHGRWLDGGEPGRPAPEAFATAALRLLFCRLSPYDDVVHSITHRLLGWAARQVPGVYVDFAWIPPRADAVALARAGVPVWLASGCKRPPTAFDLLAISLAVPQEALNLPAALQGSGLPLGSAARLADPHLPLLVLGGNAAGSVPFLHGDVPGGDGGLVDAVCNGDGVLWLQDFLRRLLAFRTTGGRDKRQFLLACARELPGTYVPWVPAAEPQPDTRPTPVAYRADPHAAWLDGYDGCFVPFADEDLEETLPLTTGCHFRCRFCQTGWVHGRLRDSPLPALEAAARRLKAATAATDLNLLAADACSLDGLATILATLSTVFRRVSVKSLALASLARHPEIAGILGALEKHEFTFGIEGISDRLRRYLGKDAEPALLDAAITALVPAGLRQVKLFFIATGLEEEADLREYASLLRRAARAARGARVIASFTPLFNAPFTPLQFAALRSPPPGRIRELERLSETLGVECRWSCPAAEIRLINLFCRAGRAATPALVELSCIDRVRYDGALPATALAATEERLVAAGLTLTNLEAEQPAATVLPWDDLACGTPREALVASWEKARLLAAEARVPPPAAAAPAVRRPARPSPATTGVQPSELVVFWGWLAPAAAWHPRPTLARGLLRDYFALAPGAAAAYRGEPRLRTPAGLAGLALLEARFAGVVTDLPAVPPPPAPLHLRSPQTLLAGPLPPPDIDFENALFALELDGIDPDTAAARLDAWLRQARGRCQTRRRDGRRWCTVAPGYRSRTGLWAWAEPAVPGAGLLLVCGSAWPAAAASQPGGFGLPVLRTILTPALHGCPKCRGAAIISVQRGLPSETPGCLDCLG